MNPSGEYGVVQYGNDKDLFVLFYKKSVENPLKSKEAGRPIYEERDYIKIQHPGEQLNKIDRPVREEDKYRFPNQWSRYLHNQTQMPEGTPIDLLFPNHPAIADNLKALNVFTVEQLANISAHAQDTIGLGAVEYVNKAKNYIKSAEKGVGFHKMQEELHNRDREIATLKHQLEIQKRQIDDLIARIANPDQHSYSPPFNPQHDVQSERINSVHPTNEMSINSPSEKAEFDLSGNRIKSTKGAYKGRPGRSKKVSPPKDELEHIKLMEANSEENFSLEDDPLFSDI